MTIGASIFLIAAGAILRFAVNTQVDAVDLATIGNILMIAGAVGLVIGLALLASARRRGIAAVPDEPVVVDRNIRR